MQDKLYVHLHKKLDYMYRVPQIQEQKFEEFVDFAWK